jgi:hypothetical protein
VKATRENIFDASSGLVQGPSEREKSSAAITREFSYAMYAVWSAFAPKCCQLKALGSENAMFSFLKGKLTNSAQDGDCLDKAVEVSFSNICICTRNLLLFKVEKKVYISSCYVP